MDKTLTCDCGFVAQARDDVGLVTEVRRHAWEVHGMPLSHDEALLLLFHCRAGRSDRDPRATTDRNRNGGAMKRRGG